MSTVNEEYPLTLEQAFEAAKSGKKIVHRYFLDHEHIAYVGGQFVTEDNHELPGMYYYETNTAFHTGWAIKE